MTVSRLASVWGDEFTVASCLQQLVGDSYTVVNGAVGSYNGDQAAGMADRLSQSEDFDALIYVACQNDYMFEKDWNAAAVRALAKLEPLKERFDGHIVVMLHTFMEYTMQGHLHRQWLGQRARRQNRRSEGNC